MVVVFLIDTGSMPVSVCGKPMCPLRCDNIRCFPSSAIASKRGVIEDFSANFEAGDVTGFCGSDTAGLERLLGVLGLLEKPDGGCLYLFGQDTVGMSVPVLTRLRDTSVGFLFTHPHLLPTFTAAENVAMPYLRICGDGEVQERTVAALEFAGVAEVHGILAGDLPDAVHWRVAFARAIVHSPGVLIAVTPPNPVLLPLARRLADEFGTCILWNGLKDDLLPYCDQMFEIYLPGQPVGS